MSNSEPAQIAESVCEHCEGRGWVPAEGHSIEHGSEPCPFCSDPEQSDGPLLCENCGKPMAEHDDMAHCWVQALGTQSDG